MFLLSHTRPLSSLFPPFFLKSAPMGDSTRTSMPTRDIGFNSPAPLVIIDINKDAPHLIGRRYSIDSAVVRVIQPGPCLCGVERRHACDMYVHSRVESLTICLCFLLCNFDAIFFYHQSLRLLFQVSDNENYRCSLIPTSAKSTFQTRRSSSIHSDQQHSKPRQRWVS